MDKRNSLNDLSNKEWVKYTKSVWQSVPGPRDQLKIQHPATFAESDIGNLLKYFTKKGNKVLDPFVGVGSTLIACEENQRIGFGIELIPKWADIARKRLDRVQFEIDFTDGSEEKYSQTLLEGDALKQIASFENSFFDFIVTSPPYWKILQKDNDHKVKKERKSKGLDTKYSENENDLGNIESYKEFINKLQKIFLECQRTLIEKKYFALIVSDFRDKSRYYSFHSDLIPVVSECGFNHEGIIILVQNNKTLYPYGIPYSFVPNIHHQYILIFRKNST